MSAPRVVVNFDSGVVNSENVGGVPRESRENRDNPKPLAMALTENLESISPSIGDNEETDVLARALKTLTGSENTHGALKTLKNEDGDDKALKLPSVPHLTDHNMLLLLRRGRAQNRVLDDHEARVTARLGRQTHNLHENRIERALARRDLFERMAMGLKSKIQQIHKALRECESKFDEVDKRIVTLCVTRSKFDKLISQMETVIRANAKRVRIEIDLDRNCERRFDKVFIDKALGIVAPE